MPEVVEKMRKKRMNPDYQIKMPDDETLRTNYKLRITKEVERK